MLTTDRHHGHNMHPATPPLPRTQKRDAPKVPVLRYLVYKVSIINKYTHTYMNTTIKIIIKTPQKIKGSFNIGNFGTAQLNWRSN